MIALVYKHQYENCMKFLDWDGEPSTAESLEFASNLYPQYQATYKDFSDPNSSTVGQALGTGTLIGQLSEQSRLAHFRVVIIL